MKIIVTGASGLVGSAISRRLFASGAKLVIAGRNRQKLYNGGLDAESTSDTSPYAWSGDLRDESACRNLIEYSVRAMDGIDVLINNAGVFHFSAFEELDHAAIAELMCINVLVPAYLTRLALPYLKASKNAVVVNISSLAGQASLPGGAAYAASKWALQGLSHSIREELRDVSVRVCTISPCQVEVLHNHSTGTARTITPECIANAVALLLAHTEGSAASLDLILH
ncbi:SDR family oxidoreductase [Pandoraea sp. NPDC090278]|uniref:SDR family oxidoreductase n=1 Tax=Pandoraea sp. NPDC090278 TaxID=3364391 RepID=UPI00383A0B43